MKIGILKLVQPRLQDSVQTFLRCSESGIVTPTESGIAKYELTTVIVHRPKATRIKTRR